MSIKKPVYFMVDLETTGTIPGRHAIAEIGAVSLPLSEKRSFSQTVSPFLGAEADPESMAIHGIHPTTLEWNAATPGAAMQSFQEWVLRQAGGRTPVFCGWAAHFDHAFLAWYLGRYGIANPFHRAVLDTKALAAGYLHLDWAELNAGEIRQRLKLEERRPRHRALLDALDQAEILERLLELVGA